MHQRDPTSWIDGACRVRTGLGRNDDGDDDDDDDENDDGCVV